MMCEKRVDAGSRVLGFSNASTSAAGSTSLDIISLVEKTVDSLTRDQQNLTALIKLGYEAIEQINTCPESKPIDSTGEIRDGLERLEENWRAIYNNCKNRIQAAKEDSELNGHYEDAVIAEYNNLVELCEELHEVTVDLKWAVMEHDADLESSSGNKYSSIDELFKAMDEDDG